MQIHEPETRICKALAMSFPGLMTKILYNLPHGHQYRGAGIQTRDSLQTE